MTSRADIVVGLDVTSHRARAAAFRLGPGTGPLATSVVPSPVAVSAEGHVTQSPEVVLATARKALVATVCQFDPAQVKAIACTTSQHGLIGLDEQLTPLTPVITRSDVRAFDQARILHTTDQARELHERSGIPVQAVSPLVKLMWLGEHEARLFARIWWWVDLKAWLMYALTGRLVTDRSNAVATGLYELGGHSWRAASLDVAGVAPEQLPEVVDTTQTFALCPRMAARTSLPAGTAVVAGAGSAVSQTLGTGATEVGVAGLALTAGGGLRAVIDEPLVDDHGQLACFPATDQLWVLGATVIDPSHLDAHHDLMTTSIDAVTRSAGIVADEVHAVTPFRQVLACGSVTSDPEWVAALRGSLDGPVQLVDDAGGACLGAAALAVLAQRRAATLTQARNLLVGPLRHHLRAAGDPVFAG